jgi:short chain enoyl-CoA hydratase (EC 4.2.1.17)
MGRILTENRGPVSIVTLNRPEVMNAMDYPLLVELGETVEALRYSDTRVIIFTGAGEKAFSAGADLKERKTLTDREVCRNVEKIRSVFQSIADLPQPTIAAVNGHAFGGGFELMLACDFRILSETAVMGMTEVSWGIIPGGGGTQRLPRLIGEAKAKELILAAKKIHAREALQYGIATEVVEAGRLMEACFALADRLLEQGPIALRQAKYAINKGLDVDLKTGLEIEGQAYEFTIPTEDRLEALTAFQEKRKPVFKGR